MSNCLELEKNYGSLKAKFNYFQEQNDLLKRQQMSLFNINNLLFQRRPLCGPSCQRERMINSLLQKYLDAQTNLQTAPKQVEDTKKNYYVYAYGDPYYEALIERELREKAEHIASLLTENFNEEVSTATTMNTYYNSEIISYNELIEAYNKYLEDNKELLFLLRERQGNILTNDRKTYYERDASDRLNLWYKFFWWIYYMMVVVWIISVIFVLQKVGIVEIIILLLLIFYPYYISIIVNNIYNLVKNLYNRLPKNVYNNL